MSGRRRHFCRPGPHVAHDSGRRWVSRTFVVDAHSRFTAIQRARAIAAEYGSVHPHRSTAREASPGRYEVRLAVAG